MIRTGAALGVLILLTATPAAQAAPLNAMTAQVEPGPKFAGLGGADNKRFLTQYGAQADAHDINGGIEFKILQNGYGKRPSAIDKVIVYYKGQLIDGRVFDQTEPGLPATFTVNALIPGWTEVLQRMREGDHWQVVIPAYLAYGSRGAPPVIPGDQTLIFDLQLVKVLPPDKQEQSSGDDQGQ